MKSQKGLKDRGIGPDFDVLLFADNGVRTKKVLGRGALSMARCEHPTHHINWGTYSWRTETGKIVWEIVFNADHAPVVFCLNVLNRLGENRLQSFLIIGCVC